MKQIIRLTEGDLRRMIKNSVNEALNEIADTHKGLGVVGKVAGRALKRLSNKEGDKDKNNEIIQNALQYLPGGKRDHSIDWGDGEDGYANTLHRATRMNAFLNGMGSAYDEKK